MEDKKTLVKLWMEYGDRDLHTAEIIHAHASEYSDMIGFHCQQAVEKYIKAYLIFLNIEFPNTHNLTLLLDLVKDKADFKEDFSEQANELKVFAVEVRYPLGKVDLSTIDLNNKIKTANDFRTEIVARIK